MTIQTTARIAGSALCSWGTGGDWANGCENVALPGFDLCPSHERISQYLEAQAAQRPMSVRIDVVDDENLIEEAIEVGCAAVEITEGYRPYGTTVYVVNGPEKAVLGLLKDWGYDDGCYEVLS